MRNNQILFNSSIVTAAIVTGRFRAAHVQFYMELYEDFLHYNRLGKDMTVQPIQIDRALKKLEEQNLGSRSKSGSEKYYELHGEGVYHLVKEMVETSCLLPLNQVIFIRYIIVCYKKQIMDLVQNSKTLAKQTIGEHIVELLDPEYILDQQLNILQSAINDLKSRLDDYSEFQSFIDDNLPEKEIDKNFIEQFSQKFKFKWEKTFP